MKNAILLLGSNQGNRELMLQSAIGKIEEQIGEVAKKSSVYETAPWGFNSNESFLNQVILIHANLSPHELLYTLLIIEEELGRTRSENQYQSRSIDIDILFVDNIEINEPDLTIPHPRLHKRLFTLIPLAEITGTFIHPVFDKTIDYLLDSCDDTLHVKKYHQEPGNIMVENEI